MRNNWTFLGWFYHRDGRRIGPFPPQEITRLVACGELRACEEVLQAWKDDNSRTRYFINTLNLADKRPAARWRGRLLESGGASGTRPG